jgi:hypothetical protein
MVGTNATVSPRLRNPATALRKAEIVRATGRLADMVQVNHKSSEFSCRA